MFPGQRAEHVDRPVHHRRVDVMRRRRQVRPLRPRAGVDVEHLHRRDHAELPVEAAEHVHLAVDPHHRGLLGRTKRQVRPVRPWHLRRAARRIAGAAGRTIRSLLSVVTARHRHRPHHHPARHARPESHWVCDAHGVGYHGKRVPPTPGSAHKAICPPQLDNVRRAAMRIRERCTSCRWAVRSASFRLCYMQSRISDLQCEPALQRRFACVPGNQQKCFFRRGTARKVLDRNAFSCTHGAM